MKFSKDINKEEEIKSKDIAGWWEDNGLMAQLARTNDDMESGKDPGISWTEAKKQLLQKMLI